MNNKLILLLGLASLTAVAGLIFETVKTNKPSENPEVGGFGGSDRVLSLQTSSPMASPESKASTKAIFVDITTPADGSKVSSSSVIVRGKTIPNADVFVNDADTKADANGNFSVRVSLDEGENDIAVIANDSVGNFIEKDILVTSETF